jgi:predicted RNA-binding protein with PIN domain
MYIIDGNNLMGQKRTRLELLRLLADYLELKGTPLQVVFDGAPDPGFPEGKTFRGIKVVYSRRGRNADARIKEMIAQLAKPREYILVSSDINLANYARIHGLRRLTSVEFLRQIETALHQKAKQVKSEKPANDHSLNEWLRYFGYAPGEDE